MREESVLPLGQQQARTRWGTHESGAAFDQKKRVYLTHEAQAFLQQQASCVIAGRGAGNELDAQLFMECPGFVEIHDSQTCLLHLRNRGESPLLIQAVQQASSAGEAAPIAFFCISHSTRERLCVHGKARLLSRNVPPRLSSWEQERSLCLQFTVERSFFHCAKYIRTRVPGLTTPLLPTPLQRWRPQDALSSPRDHLCEQVRAFLAQQILCFLCTVSRDGQYAVNHRGGAAGFLLALPPDAAAPGGTLLLPDYAGNGAFEAVGNILETGRATILVPNYAAQLAVCVEGAARVYEMEEVAAHLAEQCPGAERILALSVERIAVQSGDWSCTLAYERAHAEALGVTTDADLFVLSER